MRRYPSFAELAEIDMGLTACTVLVALVLGVAVASIGIEQAWPGTEATGKSRARGPAIAVRRRRRLGFGRFLISHNVYYVQSVPGGAGVPFASITALLCQAKKPASPACPSRLGSYGFLHRPIRVCGSIQSLIGNESQRSQ